LAGTVCFLLLKTSNQGSGDFQDQPLQATGRPLYERIAETIHDLGQQLVGECRYSSIGAVIGATFPEDARRLRSLLPRSYILIPGYGAQGAGGREAAACFNEDGLGAIVNSARGITYSYSNPNLTAESFTESVRENTLRMIDDVTTAVKQPSKARLPTGAL
jgi:orotidine-5'-phosphate decarboxylase